MSLALGSLSLTVNPESSCVLLMASPPDSSDIAVVESYSIASVELVCSKPFNPITKKIRKTILIIVEYFQLPSTPWAL